MGFNSGFEGLKCRILYAAFAHCPTWCWLQLLIFLMFSEYLFQNPHEGTISIPIIHYMAISYTLVYV